MQKKTKPQPQLSKESTAADTLSAPDQMSDVSDFRLYNIYHTADKCPFTVFEDCIIDGDLSGLGSAPEPVLADAFDNIYSQYLQQIDDGDNAAKMLQLSRIYVLSSKTDRIRSLCAHVLDIMRLPVPEPDILRLCQPIFEALTESGYRIDSPAGINHVVAMVKSDEMMLRQLLSAMPKEEGGEKISRDYFDRVIVKMEMFMKVPIHKKDITVSKYCAYFNEMKTAWQRQQQNRGGR